jgi:phosphoglycolate phosphatase-like HAD superfamily hydrolase
MTELTSWRDGAARRAIDAFVASVTTGPDAVPEADRIAVFDNDGTLWSEKPMPTQLHYVVQGWQKAIQDDPSLTDRQPYKAVSEGDFAWIGGAVDKHYQGDDSDLRTLIGALVGQVVDLTVEQYAASVVEFFATAKHLTRGVPYSETAYRPMVELLRHLEAHGFACYIVSAGERDFMRPMAEDIYGIPPERIIGSSFGLSYDEDSRQVKYTDKLSFFDDGPEKPPRIWTRIGRRPILAVGNANGDMAMLDYALHGERPSLAMLVHHDDPDRGDTPYDKGAEQALAAADERGYTVISVRDDWSAVFPA